MEDDALEVIGRRYPALTKTLRFDDLLEDSNVDAVAIATPVGTHYGLAAAALRSDKHVFVEKPLATSSDEALELMALAQRRGLVLMPGHTFLDSPPVTMIKELIDSRALGDIYFISTSRVNLGIHQPDVSVLWDLGSHDFSILRYWLDECPVSVSAMTRGCIVPEVADVAFINLEFSWGTIAHVEISWLAPSKLRRTTIVGSDKMLIYDDTSNEPVRIFDSGVHVRDPQTFGGYRLTYRTGDIVSPRVGSEEPLSLEMHDFCRAVRSGSSPRSPPEIGLDMIKTIEAVEESLRAVEIRSVAVPAPSERRLPNPPHLQ